MHFFIIPGREKLKQRCGNENWKLTKNITPASVIVSLGILNLQNPYPVIAVTI